MGEVKICTKCEVNPFYTTSATNNWCPDCKAEIFERNRGAKSSTLAERAQHPPVAIFRPGDAGFAERAAECTPIDQI